MQPAERKLVPKSGAAISPACAQIGARLRSSAKLQSAGILLFRLGGKEVEVLLAHPGGPFWRHKDHGSWTIPKGLIALGEGPANRSVPRIRRRDRISPGGATDINAKQAGGKLVHVWAVRDGWNPADLLSNRFEIEWPPRSGRRKVFSEILSPDIRGSQRDGRLPHLPRSLWALLMLGSSWDSASFSSTGS